MNKSRKKLGGGGERKEKKKKVGFGYTEFSPGATQVLYCDTM